MSESTEHTFRIYPKPSPEESAMVASWIPHSAFVCLRDVSDQDNPFEIIRVADGANPIEVANATGIDLDNIGVVAVEQSRYNMFPSELGIRLACAYLMMSLTDDRDTVYVYDSSIDSILCNYEFRKEPYGLYSERQLRANGENPPMKVWSGGKIVWDDDVPDRYCRFLEERYQLAIASSVYGHLQSSLIGGRQPKTVPIQDVVTAANRSIDLFDRLTFGKSKCYQHHFDCSIPEIDNPRDAWVLSHVSFAKFVPIDIPWADEAAALASGVVKIWRTLCAANGSFIQEEWENPKLVEQGYDFGVDFAIASYLEGVALEYLLSGWDAKGNSYDDIPF